jgi:nucleoside-diphosphate-sugar epimerase
MAAWPLGSVGVRILLTGSNGFIGRQVTRDAIDRGWDVIGVGRAEHPAGPVTRYIRQDLAEPLHFDAEVDAVIHAAGLATPWAPPAAYQRNNVVATRRVIAWAAAHGRPHLLYVSSSSVFYRDADQLGLTEDSPIPADDEQINTYSRTKLAGERLTRAYPGAWAVLRPRAVFGLGDTVLLPRVLAAARRGVLPRFTRRDGHRVRADLTPVGTVSHYLLETVARRVTGDLNLTNSETVELDPFVDDLLSQLGLDPRRPRVPVPVAMALAGAAERWSARFAGYAEPPITRYGVSMFAHSKTFDASRTRAVLGPSPCTVAQTVAEVVAAGA